MACADAGAGNSSAATGSAAASLARLDIEFLLGERDEPEAAIFDGVANAKIAAELADDAADHANLLDWHQDVAVGPLHGLVGADVGRSEEHTSELQSLMRIPYAVLCLKKKNSKA